MSHFSCHTAYGKDRNRIIPRKATPRFRCAFNTNPVRNQISKLPVWDIDQNKAEA